MLELLLGMALGALAFTEQGHEIGNKIGGMALDAAKKVMSNEKSDQSAKRPAGTPGDAGPDR